MQPFQILMLGIAFFTLSGCEQTPLSPEQLMLNLSQYYGKTVSVQAKLSSRLRCRLETATGEWMTYCGECQICRGPWVIMADANTRVDETSTESNPYMLISGSWKGRPAQCEGPLNRIKCYPFEEGQTYVINGLLERATPPRLYIKGFREVPQDKK
ncbi:MAG: hypothetical protein KTR25_18490 [Myxococcales bacterium]|nr:hypothetical protein [Myxococcales bacterium]